MLTLSPVSFSFLGGPYIDIYGGSAAGGPGGSQLGGYVYAVDDNSVAIFQDFYSRSSGTYHSGFGVWVVDGASGAYTYYSTVPYAGNYIQSIINYGGGNFLVVISNGGTYFVTVGNLKLNNASPILLPTASAPVSNPCYAQPVTRMYYDAAHKYLGCGWYDAVGQYGGPIYTSTYKVGSSGALALVGQGNSGSYLSAGGGPGAPSDDWDKTSANGGPAVSKTFSQSNGINGGQGTTAGYTKFVAQNAYNVFPGGFTDCSHSNGAYVTSLIASIFDTGIGGTSGTTPNVDCNYGTFAGLYWPGMGTGSTGGLVLGDGVLSFTVPFKPGQPWYAVSPSLGVVLTRKYLFVQAPNGWDSGGAYGKHYCLYIANAPSAIVSGYSVAKRTIGLINGARPISVTGKYKA